MALITTFVTTPLAASLYPPWYQIKIEAWKRGEIDWSNEKADFTQTENVGASESLTYDRLDLHKVRKILVYLRLDNMPATLAFMTLLGGTPLSSAARIHPSRQAPKVSGEGKEEVILEEKKRPIEAHGMRMMELTGRSSSVMKVSELEEYSSLDPLVNTFRTVGRLHNLTVSGEVTMLPEDGYADALAGKANSLSSDLLLLPWTETGSISESQIISSETISWKLATPEYTNFVSNALAVGNCTTAVFINRNFGGTTTREPRPGGLKRRMSVSSIRSQSWITPMAPVADRSHHIFCPFFGGSDDRAALRLVLQMAENPDVTATIVHFETPSGYDLPTSPRGDEIMQDILTVHPKDGNRPGEHDLAFFTSLRNSLPVEIAARVVFETNPSAAGLARSVIERAATEVGQAPRIAGDLIVCGRSSKRATTFAREVGSSASDVDYCLSFLGAELVRTRAKASVIVVQAGQGLNRGQ